MSEERKELKDRELEQVVGGLFVFNPQTMIMTYTHEDGSVTEHPILKYDEAWKMSNDLHGQNYREDTILKKMKQAGYIG